MPTIATALVNTTLQQGISSRNCFVSNRAVYTEQFQVNYSASKLNPISLPKNTSKLARSLPKLG